MKISLSILFLVCSVLVISAQINFEKLNALPVIQGTYLDGIENDWLIKRPAEKATLFRNKENNGRKCNKIIEESVVISFIFLSFPLFLQF